MFKKMREDYASVREAVMMNKAYNAYLDASACKQGGCPITHAKLAVDKITSYESMTNRQKVYYHTIKELKHMAKFSIGLLAVSGLFYTYLADKNVIIVNPELLSEEE